MSIPIQRRDNCRMCGGRNLELVLQLAPTPIGADYVTADRLNEIQDSYPIDLFLCLNCGYSGLLDVVAPEILFTDSTEITSMSLGVVENQRQLAEFVSQRVNPPVNSLVVDIGSNDGTLLKFFQNRGLRVLGIEAAQFAAMTASDNGINTMSNFFDGELAQKIRAEYGPAEVVTATRVFANIDDVADITDGFRSLMSDDGVFVFETGYLADILQDALFETIYHEHLSYDSAKPLVNFFLSHGMELIDIERIPIKGGSLRGIVQIAGGPRKVSPSVAALVEYEINLGLDRPAIFADLNSRLDRIKSELDKCIAELTGKGKSIAGYGASVGSTTMIYHFGLGEALTFLADDDPRHQNLFSPGHHIPVLTGQALYDQKPDYVLILAWRYADAIIKNHQEFLDQGGHFIVPMPEVKII